jgi:epoxyqueuosine reductase
LVIATANTIAAHIVTVKPNCNTAFDPGTSPDLLWVQSAHRFGIIVPMALTSDIKNRAIELGFDLVGVTDSSPLGAEHVEFLTRWLETGCAGRMDYMHRNFEKRIDPRALLKNAESVIVVGLNYRPPQRQPVPPGRPLGRVADYAQYEDYHLFIKQRLHELAEFAASLTDLSARFKICVDSAPLAERALAARAGLGFIGKNHMLINPDLGPQIFLGEIITTLRLQPDQPIPGACSACSRCMDACPTGALGADGRFDARTCLSYLTIEYNGEIPSDLAGKIGDRLFGCDQCVLACPCRHKAPPCKNSQFRFYPERARLDLNEVLAMTAQSFESGFADSPLKRPGIERLKRNARICMENLTRRTR